MQIICKKEHNLHPKNKDYEEIYSVDGRISSTFSKMGRAVKNSPNI